MENVDEQTKNKIVRKCWPLKLKNQGWQQTFYAQHFSVWGILLHWIRLRIFNYCSYSTRWLRAIGIFCWFSDQVVHNIYPHNMENRKKFTTFSEHNRAIKYSLLPSTLSFDVMIIIGCVSDRSWFAKFDWQVLTHKFRKRLRGIRIKNKFFCGALAIIFYFRCFPRR